MAPKANSKAADEVKLAKEKILQIKRQILQSVEALLESSIGEKVFLKNCSKLCKQDYDDVVEERSIENLCGYPLCNNAIKKVLKQQFHIHGNKVYDLSDRKHFCSNKCYSASDFVKVQLPDLPLYMRKEEKRKNINLSSKTTNRGVPGEEVLFHHRVDVAQIEPASILEPESLSQSHFTNLLHEDVKGCVEQIESLEIKENVCKSPYVFNSSVSKVSDIVKRKEKEPSSRSSTDDETDEEDDQYTLFPEHDNLHSLSDKLMPVPKQEKKAVFISPLKHRDMSSSSPAATLSIEHINNIFQDWFTEDTMKYLLGEKEMYTLKADMLFETIVESDGKSNPKKLTSIKNEYVDLCLKIDKLQIDEDSDDMDDESSMKTEMPTQLKSDSRAPKKKVNKKSKGKKKSVSFKGVEKPDDSVPSEHSNSAQQDEESTLSEPVLPLVDSVSQNALRRKVLLSKLKSVYLEILPLVELSYSDIRDGVAAIVESFSLTPTNIIFKPKEWKCIAVVIFELLRKTKYQDLDVDVASFSKVWGNWKSPAIEDEKVENLVAELLSPSQIKKLQSSYG